MLKFCIFLLPLTLRIAKVLNSQLKTLAPHDKIHQFYFVSLTFAINRAML